MAYGHSRVLLQHHHRDRLSDCDAPPEHRHPASVELYPVMMQYLHHGFSRACVEGVPGSDEELGNGLVGDRIHVLRRVQHRPEPLAVYPFRKRPQQYDPVHALVLVDSLQRYLQKRLAGIRREVDGLGLYAVYPALAEYGVLVILLSRIISDSDHGKLGDYVLLRKLPDSIPYVYLYFFFYSVAVYLTEHPSFPS